MIGASSARRQSELPVAPPAGEPSNFERESNRRMRGQQQQQEEEFAVGWWAQARLLLLARSLALGLALAETQTSATSPLFEPTFQPLNRWAALVAGNPSAWCDRGRRGFDTGG